MRLRCFLAIVVLLTTLLPLQATAQSDPHSASTDAEAHYQTAVTLFGEGRYREALDEFDAAIALSPESIFFCNRAIVLIQLTEVDAALESLETCQSTFTGDPTELAAIDAQRQAVNTVVRTVRSGAFDTVSAINAPMLSADESQRPWNRASTGYVLLAVGGAFLASAGTLDLLSSDLRRSLEEEAAGRRGSNEQSYTEAREAYVNRQRIWLALTGVGAIAAATGAVLVGSVWLSPDAETDVALSVGGSSGAVGFKFRKRF